MTYEAQAVDTNGKLGLQGSARDSRLYKQPCSSEIETA